MGQGTAMGARQTALTDNTNTHVISAALFNMRSIVYITPILLGCAAALQCRKGHDFSIHCGAREGGMVRFDRCRIDDKEKLEIEHCANDADFECFIEISDFPSLKNDHFIEDIFAHDLNGNTELIVDMGKQVTGRSAGCRRRSGILDEEHKDLEVGSKPDSRNCHSPIDKTLEAHTITCACWNSKEHLDSKEEDFDYPCNDVLFVPENYQTHIEHRYHYLEHQRQRAEEL